MNNEDERDCLVLSLLELLDELNNLYYNEGESPLSDECYDELVNLMCDDFHEVKQYISKNVGHSVNTTDSTGQEVSLPFYMGSMNKMKKEKEIKLWCSKYSSQNASQDTPIKYVASAKLDGISALYHDGRLYSRGNGSQGRDITFLIPYINLNNNKTRQVTLRGELIINKKTFIEKYSKEYANARNLVCGIMNRKYDKKYETFYNDIEFIIYDIYDDTLSPEMKFNILRKQSYNYVTHWNLDGDINMDILNTLLVKWKKQYNYEIDGIIISHNNIYKLKENENPKYSIAYKNNDICVSQEEGVVDKVIWNISKDNYIKPKIKLIEPIVCDTSKIEYVTGFNAKYIIENGIMHGSKLLIGLSGNVIPHIFKVISSTLEGKITGKLGLTDCIELGLIPSFEEVGSQFVWSKNKVDLILVDKNNVSSVIKRNMMFFKNMGMKCGLQETTLINVYKQKGLYKLGDILSLTLDEWVSFDGIGEKKANTFMNTFKQYLNWSNIIQDKTIDETQNIKYDYLVKFAVGSQCFPRGYSVKKIVSHLSCLHQLSVKDKKIFDVCEYYNNGYIRDTSKWVYERIGPFKGITNDSMEGFIQGFQDFNVFMLLMYNHTKMRNVTKIIIPSVETLLTYYEDNDKEPEIPSVKNENTKTFVFTGFRSKDLENIIKSKGHIIGDAINKKTNYLVVKDKTKISSKVKKAMDSGTINIIGINDVNDVL